jgi:thiol-disulfide isomerase/thioredoxin
MRRPHPLITGLLVTLFAVGAGLYASQQIGSRDKIKSGNIARAALARLQAVNLPDVAGQTQPMAQWQGKTVVVNFWATWCPPCRQEMPGFSRLQEKFGDKGVQFVGIGVDSPSAIKEYALQNPMAYPLLIGGSTALDLLRQLGNPTAALPYTLVLDASGKPIFSKLGMVDELSLEKRLQPLLTVTTGSE